MSRTTSRPSRTPASDRSQLRGRRTGVVPRRRGRAGSPSRGRAGSRVQLARRGLGACVLVDTGLGLADIAAAIEPVAAAPTIVVNSHVHFDHVGGNELFDHVEMHELGPEWIEFATRDEEVSGYQEVAEGMYESWDRLQEADRDGWFLIGPDETMRPWPRERVAELGWRIDPPQPTRLLADGDTVELGIGPFASSTHPATPRTTSASSTRPRGSCSPKTRRTTGRCWSTSRAPTRPPTPARRADSPTSSPA